MGFPPQLLPRLWNPTGNSSSVADLELPLDPNNTPGLRTVVQVYPGPWARPKRSELVMSLATEIYWYWRDTANRPIDVNTNSQRPPFQKFLYNLRPSHVPGALFTPFRAGITCFRILAAVLARDLLTGHIVAETSLIPADKSIGTLYVTNTGSAHLPDSSVAATQIKELENGFWSNETYNFLLIHLEHNTSAMEVLDNVMERRYFKCLSEGFADIIRRPTFGLVTDLLPSPSFPLTPINYNLRCNTGPATFLSRDKIIITIYPLTPLQRQAFMWIKLAEELLVLGTSVSLGYHMDSIGIITDTQSDRRLGTIQIKLYQGENASNESSTPDVTTA
ncbi:MAG: hypothetical protein Q9223_003024 [Gallowayella weberi]